MLLTKWGITWFILCLIGALMAGVSDFWLAMTLAEKYNNTFAVYVTVFLLLGFALLLATIIIDITLFIKKKKQPAK